VPGDSVITMPQLLVEKSNLDSETLHELASMPQQAQLRGERIDHFTSLTFVELFEDQAARATRNVAVTCEDEQLTFGELNVRANQLARHLRAHGVGRESLVGICVDRSLDMAVGILGILKSGAGYLPLDPEYPKERLAFMLDDARPVLVLTESKRANLVSDKAAQVVSLDSDWTDISSQSEENLDDAPRPEDLAYVIYTSGSTGKPKGVMIEHRNLANYLLGLNHELHINAGDLYLHTASIAFSSSRRQLMLPLSQGATVVIATSEERKDPLALFAMIKRRGVTVMDAVPSFWRNCTSILVGLDKKTRQDLLDNKLRLMLSASEPLLADIPRAWHSEFRHPARHVHMFGQTETAGIVSLYHVPTEIDPEVNVIPIGQPIANNEICILDEEGQPCPLGVAGELHIGGAGVGRGYLNRPELTAEKFIARPFSQDPNARLYRTGDWAKLNPNGLIEFAGRRDQQVKLRGFRIELAEIEAAIVKHPSVKECVVVPRQENNDKRLMAYFVANGAAPTIAELRDYLSTQLPDYSVPSGFVEMEALPLSANGKVNRLALPDPDNHRPNLSSQYTEARTTTEKQLAKIWSAVLRVDRVGVHDNFFELGGHSLLAAQIIARVRHDLKADVSLRLLFESPTVALMAVAIKQAGLPGLSFSGSIEPSQRNGKAPLSFTQQQFWLLDQAEPNNSSYNIRTAIEISGALDEPRLQQALQAIVDRHENLRTNIIANEGHPLQVISPKVTVTVASADLSPLAMAERERETKRALDAEAEEQFDLANGPLFRFKLLKLASDRHVLLLTIHHIICDAWSVGLLLRELAAFYQDARVNECVSLPRLKIQYADFAMWQRERLQGPTLEKQLDYWKDQLAGAPPMLELPTDYPRPEKLSANGAQVSIALTADATRAIKEFSRNENVTLFMTLLAAFQTLLSRYSGQADIVVGSPIAGRSMLETENLIGAFVNTIVLRGNLADNPSFREFLGRVRESTLGAFAHQDLPFEKLIEAINPERATNRTPLFQVMFALQNTPAADVAMAGLKLKPLKLDRVKSKFDLTLEVEEEAEGLRLCFEYNTDLFAAPTIERMLGHLENLLKAVVSDSSQRVAELPFLSDSERHKLVFEWNNTRADFPEGACIHHLFEAQVARTPDAIAAEFNGQTITYAQLNRRANQLAHRLQRLGIGPDQLVGICVERSLEMIVAMLGVLKAGGAYVPLDPTYPRERIAFMIEDAGLRVMLTQSRLKPNIPSTTVDSLCIDDSESFADESKDNPNVEMSSRNLAYVIYTSGSTGNPKGVMIEHRSLVSFSEAATGAYEIKAGDRVLQFASICFDLSVEEIYPALTHGAAVVLRTEAMISSPQDFLGCCDRWKLTILDLPTAYWHDLTAALGGDQMKMPATVRLVIIGGEKASHDRVLAWRQNVGDRVRLMNTYGPTETTVVATMYDLTNWDRASALKNIPIGRPIANTNVYVLNQSLRPVPTGVAGELYIGGEGLARGYVKRPELDAERFVSHPFSDDANERLYKTGDLVRYRADGNIEFLGRVDNQVKLRGFRVELEEIEMALRSHADVSECVVVLHEDRDGDKRLVAYVVPVGGSQIVMADLRNHLKAKLPAYMLPAIFELIEALPLMPNGKIDRRALPEPQQSSSEMDESFVAPRTPVEQLLATIWCEVLKLSRMGIHDNFFEFGGHSLLAARVVSSIRAQLDVELNMVDVFQAPTIAGLAELLYPRQAQNESEGELAALLEELANLSDEEAQRRLDEMNIDGVAA
jgi:amino acid adenylation domain-containing protein